MKRNTLSFIWLLVFTLFWNGCKKEKEETQAFRILSQTVSITNQIPTRGDFKYEGDRLTSAEYYYYYESEWLLLEKQEMEYVSDEFYSYTHYQNLKLKNWQPSYKREYFRNGLDIVKLIYYERQFGEWSIGNEDHFDYDPNGWQTEWHHFEKKDNAVVETYREICHYEGHKFSAAEGFELLDGQLIQTKRFEFMYDGDLLIQVNVYTKISDTWDLSLVVQMYYANNAVIDATSEHYDHGIYRWKQSYNFSYDSYGNLIKTYYTESGGYHEIIENTYEQAKGNLKDFKNPDDWASFGNWHPQITKARGLDFYLNHHVKYDFRNP